MSCPYCGGNKFTDRYVQVQRGTDLEDEIGFNECRRCGKWSRWWSNPQGDWNQTAIENPDVRPEPS